jgi:hypothetical protein
MQGDAVLCSGTTPVNKHIPYGQKIEIVEKTVSCPFPA